MEEMRRKKGLSVRQLAYMADIPKSTLEDILKGKKTPRLDTLERLAYCLKTPMQDLYESPLKEKTGEKELSEYSDAFHGQKRRDNGHLIEKGKEKR